MRDATPVYVFNRWATPGRVVFHLTGDWGKAEPRRGRQRRFEARTRCGRIANFTEWDENPLTHQSSNTVEERPADHIRRDWVQDIGRLCRKCEAAA